MTNPEADRLRGHSLLPADLSTLPPLYSTENLRLDETVVHLHFFCAPACDWLLMEYDPQEELAFGWACLNDTQNAELGYFSLRELADLLVRTRDGVPVVVERDLHWTPRPFSQVQFSGG